MRPITRIILHCSASLAGIDLRASDIKAYHTNPISQGGRGWKHPGYHYVVRLDGTIEKLLDEKYVSNGVKGYNQDSIHICYIGGLNKQGKPANTLTAKQRASIAALLHDLRTRYPTATLHGHNEFAAKACPCFRVKDEFPELFIIH